MSFSWHYLLLFGLVTSLGTWFVMTRGKKKPERLEFSERKTNSCPIFLDQVPYRDDG